MASILGLEFAFGKDLSDLVLQDFESESTADVLVSIVIRWYELADKQSHSPVALCHQLVSIA
jgi:hypothetical protein